MSKKSRGTPQRTTLEISWQTVLNISNALWLEMVPLERHVFSGCMPNSLSLRIMSQQCLTIIQPMSRYLEEPLIWDFGILLDRFVSISLYIHTDIYIYICLCVCVCVCVSVQCNIYIYNILITNNNNNNVDGDNNNNNNRRIMID
jgi:hypothetical protein